jgi:hypothetical protein
MVVGVDARTRSRGSPDTSWGWYLVFTALSIVVHAVPVAVYLGSLMLGLRWFSTNEGEFEDHPTIIPIEFGVDELADPPKLPQPTPMPVGTAAIEEPTEPADPASRAIMNDAGLRDGSADAEPDAPTDAAQEAIEDSQPEADRDTIEDAGGDAYPVAAVGVDAGQNDDSGAVLIADAATASVAADAAGGLPGGSDAGDGGGWEPIRDPVAVAGGARLAAQRNPNVSLMVFTGQIRRHPLAARHAATLTSIQQWKVFFEGTDIDPVRDTDWINLFGPQFRNTARVGVVLRYSVADHKMRAAVNALIARSQPRGTWREKSGVPYAQLRVDNADRVVVMPQPHILVVVPPDGLDQAVGLKGARFPSGGNDRTAVLLNLKTPRNAFQGLPVDIPATIAWLRFSLELGPDGGADAKLDAEDVDEATAARDAASLTDQLEKLAVVRVLFVQQRLFDPVTFRAEGKHIRAETHFTQAQLNTILSMIGAEIDRRNKTSEAAPAR